MLKKKMTALDPDVLITAPAGFELERTFIISVLMSEFLGLRVSIDFSSTASHYHIRLPNRSIIVVEDHLFSNLSSCTNPRYPLPQKVFFTTNAFIPETDIPVLFGSDRIAVEHNRITLGLDIFGGGFLMLTRAEETLSRKHDKHGRFPARESLAFKNCFLHRPIVDEYVEMLWSMLRHLCPSLKRKTRVPRTLVSCDVDSPYRPHAKSITATLRIAMGDVLKRKSLRLSFQSILRYAGMRRGSYSRDSYTTAIDWIMDANEKAGNSVAFYFLSRNAHPIYDGNYTLYEPIISNMLRRIAERGHEIGLHGSYTSYSDAARTLLEATTLRNALRDAQIPADVSGARQHYLRWSNPITARNLEAANLQYDSSLGFADVPGFRCGTCHEFPMFDIQTRKTLRLRQRPLVLMEQSVLESRHMGLGRSEEALRYMQAMKDRCYYYNGNFTLLWHNSSLETYRDRELYLSLIT